MPKQFVESTGGRVKLTVDDFLVFLKCDGPFFPELQFRPVGLGQNRPGKPMHSDREIMRAPQEDVGGYTTLFKDF